MVWKNNLRNVPFLLNSYMKCGIYKILNTKNNKFYIGSSKDIEDRWSHHRAKLRGNKHPNQHLQLSWNKYGESHFDMIIVEECSEPDLIKREQHYLDCLGCTNKKVGYNMATKAGKGPDCTGLRQYNNIKQVNQYDLNGNYIRSFECAIDAERALGIKNSCKAIASACNRRLKNRISKAYEFMWTHGKQPQLKIKEYTREKTIYTEELRKKLSENQKRLGPSKYIQSTRKPISRYDLNGNLIETYPYANIASKRLNICEAVIKEAANLNNKIRKTAYGFQWRFGNNTIIMPK